MAEVFPLTQLSQAPAPGLHAGDYFSTERDLYRVEEVHGEYALVEDCRTETVLEVAVGEILEMNPVRRGADGA